MAAVPDFQEIKKAVLDEVIYATNTYTLITELAFPLRKQSRLCDHYPFIVDSIYNAFSWQVLLSVCRLLDPADDHRIASLATFLRRVETLHAQDQDVPSHLLQRRAAFTARIPDLLRGIDERWKRLVQHRNAYLAHRDLTKTNLPVMTYSDIRECFEFGQTILRDYLSAFEDATQFFDIVGVKDDPGRFLKWCRLDSYQKHFDEDLERWRKKQEDTIRRSKGG